jgi:hypothetical protein
MIRLIFHLLNVVAIHRAAPRALPRIDMWLAQTITWFSVRSLLIPRILHMSLLFNEDDFTSKRMACL